jgi:hypothetical protein
MTAAAALDQLTHDIGPDGEVVLRTHDGDIRVRPVDGTVVTVRRSDDGRIDDHFRVEMTPGRLEIGPRDRLNLGALVRMGDGGSDFDVDVPRGARVRLESASGSLLVEGMTGAQRYRTVSGSIRLTDAAGRIAIDQVSGDVALRGIAPISLEIRTVSGALDLTAPRFDRFEARMMSGDVHVAGRIAGAGPFTIESVSGDVTLATDGPIRVEGTFVSGSIRSDIPHVSEGRAGRRTIEIGTGGPVLRMRAISGDLRVVELTSADRDAGPDTVDATVRPPTGEVEVPAADQEAASAVASPNPRYDLRPAPPAARPSTASMSPDRPASSAAPAPPPTEGADADAQRLAVLKDLEDGHIDVDEASRRLSTIDSLARPAPSGSSADAGDDEIDRWAFRA